MFSGKTNLSKLEKLQERPLRFVFRDTTSSYEYILTRGDFLPLSCIEYDVWVLKSINVSMV